MNVSNMKHKNQNNLPKGWRKVRLGEVADIIRGVSFSKEERSLRWFEGGTPILRANNIKENGILNLDDLMYVIDSKISDEQKLRTNDIVVVASSGNKKLVGKIARIYQIDQQLSFGAFMYCIRPKSIEPRYLYLYLRSSNYKNQLQEIVEGTNINNLRKSDLANIELSIPEDPSEQKRIADILSAFDDKIELNNKIIKTLEQMAQEIFKEWFVKFRFPGWEKVKFVDSELGKIPEGWGVIDLYDYISFEGGSQPPKSMHIYEKREGYVRFIQNRDYESDAYITYIPESNRNKLCNEYDIMMDKYGEAGKVRFGLAGAYNVALAKITPKPPLMREYLRWFLKQPEIEKMIEGSAMASTRASVNKIVFKNLKILLPSRDLMEKFEEISKLYIDNYLKLRAENQTLAALRDLLLPKLMSGEIRV